MFENLQPLLDEICEDAGVATERGRAADYIPELAKIDLGQFAMSVCLADGTQVSAGDADTRFSIQSVSKVFTLALALGRHGDRVWHRVGREPSSHEFNSIQELEIRNGIPPNPFVNSGAITTTDILLAQAKPKETLGEMLRFLRLAASDDDVLINPKVALSEKRTGHRNRALAHFLKSLNNLHNEVDQTLGTYFHHCAIEMTCAQLARSGRFLAGIHPSRQLITVGRARNINALMMTCGHYNGSGEFAFRVGLPAKSGVGGGILAVLPRRASIAVWSPGLDKYGNSLLGTRALETFSRALKLSLFSIAPQPG